jgi:biopolymer transport protein ExbB
MELVLDFLDKGGPILWIILGLSVVLFTLIIERALFFFNIRSKESFLQEFFQLAEEKKYQQAEELALNQKCILSKILYTMLNKRSLSKERLKEELHIEISKEKPGLAKYLDFIAVATTASPILGLLGTVTGMIKVFNALSEVGAPQADLLARGIAEALITTEAGLIIALPCLFLHNFLATKAENLLAQIEHQGMKLLTFLSSEKPLV